MRASHGRGRAVSALVLAAVAGIVGPAGAGPRSVALGEVSTRVVRSDVDLGEVLREAVARQLTSLETPEAAKGPFVLSAALVRMESDGARVTCVVSATLRTQRGGTMLAIVEGRVGVETESALTPAIARRAVEAAARAAVIRVPEALRSVRLGEGEKS